MYHTYILHSPSKNKYFVGFTSDPLVDRLRRHNTNHSALAGFISDREVCYSENFATKAEALAREKEIKSRRANLKSKRWSTRSPND